MDKDFLGILAVLSIVFFSSACAGLGSSSAEKIVDEGNILTYEEQGGGNFTLVFMNETEDAVTVASLSSRGSSVRIDKGEWVSERGSGAELFFSALLSQLEFNSTEKLMEDGEMVTVDSSGNEINLSRSESFQWKNYQAFNVTIETENSDNPVFTVHAREPYLILKVPGEFGHELVKVNETDSPRSYYESQVKEPAEATPDVDYRAENTELALEPIYAVGVQEDQEEMKLTVTNTGERAVNTSNFELLYAPPNFPSTVSLTQLPESWKVSQSSCLVEGKILAAGERLNCGTGVKFPDALESVEVEIRSTEFDYSEKTTCSVQNDEAMSC